MSSLDSLHAQQLGELAKNFGFHENKQVRIRFTSNLLHTSKTPCFTQSTFLSFFFSRARRVYLTNLVVVTQLLTHSLPFQAIEKFLQVRKGSLTLQPSTSNIAVDDTLVNSFLDFLEQWKPSPVKEKARAREPLSTLSDEFENYKAEAHRNFNDERKQKLYNYVQGKRDNEVMRSICNTQTPLSIRGTFGVGARRTSLDHVIKRKRPFQSTGTGNASTPAAFGAGPRRASLDHVIKRRSPYEGESGWGKDFTAAAAAAAAEKPECSGGRCNGWEELDNLDLANMKIFGNQAFRHDQKRICDLALKKHDIFVLMPTGGGKSLCYQLPAAVAPGLAIVISPLLSLINDQVKALIDKDFPATYLSSSQTERERKAVYRELNKRIPSCKLLYLTPEQFVKSEALQAMLQRLFDAGLLSRLVVDEAHCISQWGHDFRVDYKSIGKVKKKLFPSLPSMALTATATRDVCTDVMKTLYMDKQKTKMFKVSFNRPNIFWKVLPKTLSNDSDGIPQYISYIAQYIKAHWMGCSGIIYCLTRDEAEETAAYLREEFGLNVGHYHAGMTSKQRNTVQLSWKAGKIPIICATIAFGMGVDNAHVRFVIHQSMPKSVEGYYQESGRAGRDGKPAEALLLYHPRDVKRVSGLIYSSRIKKKQREIQIELAKTMQSFCENTSECRRKLILSYFGEEFSRTMCSQTCDNCKLRFGT